MRCHFAFAILLFSFSAFAQLLEEKQPLTSADTLRGMLTPLRSSYDVIHYDLTFQIFQDTRSISGRNSMTVLAVDDFRRIQFDLFNNMEIHYVMFDGKMVEFERKHNAVFFNTPEKIDSGSFHKIEVVYRGTPIIAEKPPWDGGFVWDTTPSGERWIGVACEGIGASLWWPNKDHLSDEPDSVNINIIVPDTLIAVSNGIFLGAEKFDETWKIFRWKVTYPINNYNVSFYVSNYVHFTDKYLSGNDSLMLHYYVLPENLLKAKEHFQQVKPMMKCFEKYFGRFPFWKDGYKLVESPYLGMEHQSAIAYGNGYMTGYAGMDYSRIGLDFDYIIIHETGHEWWGNAVSVKDIADLWIHEGFCTYSEALYAECMHGYDTALAYINAKKPYVENAEPLIGPYNVNREGSGDMYSKGMLMLNTLRHLVDNDSAWFQLIRDIVDEFSYKTTTSAEIENFMDERIQLDLKSFFAQYLRNSKIPVLEYRLKKKNKLLEYRWKTDVSDFKMPLKATLSAGKFEWIYPTNEWKEISTQLGKKDKFQVAEDLFYINVQPLE